MDHNDVEIGSHLRLLVLAVESQRTPSPDANHTAADTEDVLIEVEIEDSPPRPMPRTPSPVATSLLAETSAPAGEAPRLEPKPKAMPTLGLRVPQSQSDLAVKQEETSDQTAQMAQPVLPEQEEPRRKFAKGSIGRFQRQQQALQSQARKPTRLRLSPGQARAIIKKSTAVKSKSKPPKSLTIPRPEEDENVESSADEKKQQQSADRGGCIPSEPSSAPTAEAQDTAIPPELEVVLPTPSADTPGDVEFTRIGTLTQDDEANPDTGHRQWFLTTPSNPEPTPVLDMPEWIRKALERFGSLSQSQEDGTKPGHRAKAASQHGSSHQCSRLYMCGTLRQRQILLAIFYQATAPIEGDLLERWMNTPIEGRLLQIKLDTDPAETINNLLQKAWQEVFPAPPPGLSSPEEPPGLLRKLWALRKACRHASATASVLQSWLMTARIQRLQRHLKKHYLQHKRERVETLLKEAEATNRPSAIFSVVRRLAPKTRHMRIQLRGPTGQLLVGVAESTCIAQYLRQVYHSQDITCPPPVNPITGIQFALEDVQKALGKLSAGKALPSAFAPARLWKLVPDIVGPALLPCMNLQSSQLLEAWHKVQLHLIPKIAIVKEPKSLRPIALLHPANKLLATMIADKILPKAMAYLASAPQWAYLPGRSTAQALESVCSHLHSVRDMLSKHSCSLLQRFQGHQPPKLLGGLSLSLDIRKAFDSLSHSYLEAAMREAQFEEAEIALILHLHSQACMQIGSHTHKAQGLSEGLTNIFADDFFSSWMFKSQEALSHALQAMGVLIHTLQEAGLQLSPEKTVILLAAKGTSLGSVLSKYRRVIQSVPHLEIRVGQQRYHFRIVQSHKYLGAKLSYHGFEKLNLQHRLHTAWGSYWRLHHLLISRSLSLRLRVRLWQACVLSVLRYSLHSVGLPPHGHQIIRQAIHRQLRMIARSPAHLWHVTSPEILHRLDLPDPWTSLCQQFTLSRWPESLVITAAHQEWRRTLSGIFSETPMVLLPTDPQPTPLLPSSKPPDQHALDKTSSYTDRSAHAPRTLTCPVCRQEFSSLAALRVHHKAKHELLEAPTEHQPERAEPGHSTPVTRNKETKRSFKARIAKQRQERAQHKAISRRNVGYHAADDLLTKGLPACLHGADPQTRFSWLHAHLGLCMCRHCQRACRNWEELKIHILTRSCEILFPDSVTLLPSQTPPNPLPPYWRLEIQELAGKGWEKVALTLQAQKADCFRYCPICGQWLIQARGITLHMQAHHAWAVPYLQLARRRAKANRKNLALSSV
ncbi:unnamed protein product, partial [Symbiodinium sp. CCMP2592]